MDFRRLISSSSSCIRRPLVTTETLCGCARCNAGATSPAVINAERRVVSLLFTVWQVPQFVSLIDSFQDHPFLTAHVTPLVKQFVFFFFPAFQVSGECCSTLRSGGKDTILTVFTAGKEKEAFSLKSTGFLVNLSSAHIQPCRKQGT